MVSVVGMGFCHGSISRPVWFVGAAAGCVGDGDDEACGSDGCGDAESEGASGDHGSTTCAAASVDDNTNAMVTSARTLSGMAIISPSTLRVARERAAFCGSYAARRV